ncbi:hypothetical protein Bcp1_073 [Bacillus phage Bcp1]|uniref:Uncharacterized protein n=2 Tax=Caeruleovirus TaxID=1911929 RepID=A0A0S2MUG5_9CAUD|nr:hypothetical protein Bcp1_073 [Bacillus phage Bcp1]YP_009626635.1 hypothetical protein FD732_gp259 [Bacillus phage BM15]AHN66550.1 hypothetical protein Bcp1_073 [Bacillus phage Bcp1]ALO79490.1 hypothetical protein BM10_86 [Bacillus phage BM15]
MLKALFGFHVVNITLHTDFS